MTSRTANNSVFLTVRYTNYRGETSVRDIVPLGIRFGSNQWHTERQWLLRAFDMDKCEEREFAMRDMQGLGGEKA